MTREKERITVTELHKSGMKTSDIYIYIYLFIHFLCTYVCIYLFIYLFFYLQILYVHKFPTVCLSRILIAPYSLVVLCWTSMTRPKEPVPKVLIRSKSLSCVLSLKKYPINLDSITIIIERFINTFTCFIVLNG